MLLLYLLYFFIIYMYTHILEDAPAPTPTPTPTPANKSKKNCKKSLPEGAPAVKKMATPLFLANKTKTTFRSATSGHLTLKSVISSNASWQWANNDITLEPLHLSDRALTRAVAGWKFAQSFLTMPTSDVKKTWRDDDEFNKECGSLAALLDPLMKSLASETSQLVNMHASRSK